MKQNSDPKPDLPRGYLKKLLRAVQDRQLVPGVFVVEVRHDDNCPFLTGKGPCTCNPDIDLPAGLPGKN